MALGVAQLAACSSDRSDPRGESKTTGKVTLALEATAQSGNVYRLRNALFEIIDIRTGRTIEFLSTEDFPASAREISTILLTGNYTARLHEGWFMERIDSGGGTGGVGGTAGTTSGGSFNTAGEGPSGDDDPRVAGFA
ncbi:MAG TPA: hypothetical protein VMS65_10480, partial [Polyangiaceae bacterium]|nr:hypothetical protein [Polyangiaceae bacterium]